MPGLTDPITRVLILYLKVETNGVLITKDLISLRLLAVFVSGPVDHVQSSQVKVKSYTSRWQSYVFDKWIDDVSICAGWDVMDDCTRLTGIGHGMRLVLFLTIREHWWHWHHSLKGVVVELLTSWDQLHWLVLLLIWAIWVPSSVLLLLKPLSERYAKFETIELPCFQKCLSIESWIICNPSFIFQQINTTFVAEVYGKAALYVS